MNFEDELRAALRREDPSPGFPQRVLAKHTVARAQSSPAQKRAIPRMLWAGAIAAMLAIGLTAAFEYRQMQAERAAREAVVALRIAADKLNMTRDRVLRLEN
jgi:hypothetical protein